MRTVPAKKIIKLRSAILRFYSLHRRNLPFRNTTDPYKITVSEIMLQQTQVDRVVPKYLAWIKRWPDWKRLARASNKQLLKAWSGLGYNRRALHLGSLARTVVNDYDGKLPDTPDELQKLPGIGPYTSRAILIFAFNKPLITIDTNIRRVILHELGLPATTPIKKVELVAWQLLPKKRSRDWHNALMDYSRLALPNRIERIPALSKQSKFDGSLRQIRGEIVRQLINKKFVSVRDVAIRLKRSQADVSKAAASLQKDGVARVRHTNVYLA